MSFWLHEATFVGVGKTQIPPILKTVIWRKSTRRRHDVINVNFARWRQLYLHPCHFFFALLTPNPKRLKPVVQFARSCEASASDLQSEIRQELMCLLSGSKCDAAQPLSN